MSNRAGADSRRLLAAATVASIVLAFIPGAELITYPIRLFSTFVHEGGHALAALITLGHVDKVVIEPNSSGVTTTLGGTRWIILMSGYLGAALFGALCLLLAKSRNGGRNSLMMMAGLVGLITLLWVPLFGNAFGFAAGAGIAALLFFIANLLKEQHARFAAAFLAMQLCLNALFDVRALMHLTFQTGMDNDAVFMSNEYGLPAAMWATLWAMGAVVILGAALRAYWRGK